MNSIYEKNIQALVEKHVYLATKLFAFTENKRYEIFQANDPVAINILDTQAQTFLYNKPVEDTLLAIDNFKDKEQYPYRYFFGIGNGILMKMLLQSFYIKRIVVIEPSLELLYIVLNLLDFSSEISEGKLVLEDAQEVDFVRALHYMGDREAKIYCKLFFLETPTPYYDNVFNAELLDTNKTFIDAIEHLVKSHGNDIIDSLMGVEHHYTNLPNMIETPKFKRLIPAKNADVAIVVSTGPSLTKQLPLLKQIQDYVTIISVDASFPILEKHGIKPDFVTVLERVPTTANFFQKNAPEFQKDVNFLMVSIVHQDVWNATRHGNRILVMRPHEYTQYFGLDDFGYLGTGMSAANLAHELAGVMEYKQCILIGQDLSFGKDGTSHAKDHFFGTEEEKHDRFDLYVEAYGGNGRVKTTEYWLLFKEYFERTITFTSSFITTVNCTEGGARIQGSVEMSFQEAVESFVDTTRPKQPIRLEYASDREKRQYIRQIIRKTKYILTQARKYQRKTEKVFIKVDRACTRLIKLNETNKLDKIDYSKLIALIEEIDSIKQFLDSAEFNTMFYDILRASIIHRELDLAVLQVRPVLTDDEKKTKLVEWIMAHRYWLFLFAGAINAQREIMIRAIKTWPEDYRKGVNLEKEEADLLRTGKAIDEETKELFRPKYLQADGTFK